ncbi:fluoride efflux transporter CrcB [Sphingomonas sp. AX6]|uniref:fluoride efflux transporter CrcB n=1 Tax=Sphingomonas sp. AX6 TaxID=2653171 RepID=UPI0012F46941|nr:fluoride efflux transporter CrcB [Sphingomonas sp. AX6]VXD00593.1 Putative fluoride ion transporter CrcB [Sphingomonas sp. AX6]
MGTLILVMAGGAVGAGARHLVGRASLSLFGPGYPWGTLAVNIVGSLAMGVLAGLLARGLVAGGEAARLLIGVGLLGGFTTFSAFSLDAVLMAERGGWIAALPYILASVIGSIVALVAGIQLVRAVTA